MNIAEQQRALLDLVEADLAGRCAAIVGAANAHAAASSAQAHASARARMRQAFAEQRALRRERLAALHAQLATLRRLHAQQRTTEQLHLAWAQLPGELSRLWALPASREAWIAKVLASATACMPRGPWRIVHAPDWAEADHQLLARHIGSGPGIAFICEADDRIAAGLEVMADGNVIDGTLGGLLADRADIEARLLRQLEAAS
jgi:hypothetical protein